MTLMGFFYQPQVQAVVEYYNGKICPVPAARQVLLHPSGWAKQALKEMKPEIGQARRLRRMRPRSPRPSSTSSSRGTTRRSATRRC